jgi:hypothetical protein
MLYRKASSKKTGEDNESEVLGKTAQELEDTWEAELQSFEPASRLTGGCEKSMFVIIYCIVFVADSVLINFV